MERRTAGKRRGRPGITLDEVRQACEELKKQGRVIGPTNVRLQLQTGGYSTIIKYLRCLGYPKKSNCD